MGSRIASAVPRPAGDGITAMRRSTTIIRLKNSSWVRTSAPSGLSAATYSRVAVLRRALCW